MLRALADRGARELRLAEGAQPVFAYPDGERAVSAASLTRGQIIALLSEVSSPDDARRISAGEPARFAYRLPDGKSFAFSSSVSDGTLAVRATPAATAPDSAPTASAAAPAASESVGLKPFDPTALRPGAPAIEAHLTYLVEVGGSDLHLSADEHPTVRLHGEMMRIPGTAACSPEETARLLFQLLPPRFKKEFESASDTDFAHEIPGVARFRCNVFADRKGVGGVFRVIPSRIPSAEDLGLPKAILDLCFLSKGLVLVTGPTGSGKSTTLATLIDHINRNRTDHILTIEDPIEFVHPSRKCLVNQREVGSHTSSFKSALRAALREDPDIVLVGEMRDLETVAIAIETAETGHLVFGTLHTSTAPSTVDRIIDQFPADRQSQIRVMLSESLKGVISQILLRRKSGGRVAAMEVLIGTPAVANLIREAKTFQIPSIMQAGRKHGMVLMVDALLDLVKRGVISADEAFLKAVDKMSLATLFKSAGIELPLVY
ncbi:MAG: type IV pilus twitching motility protein PilT [Acidobacteriia bacterium]|nr:type IV pilus twitching motility protein PilT [Terriglobia bacterium]